MVLTTRCTAAAASLAFALLSYLGIRMSCTASSNCPCRSAYSISGLRGLSRAIASETERSGPIFPVVLTPFFIDKIAAAAFFIFSSASFAACSALYSSVTSLISDAVVSGLVVPIAMSGMVSSTSSSTL